MGEVISCWGLEFDRRPVPSVSSGGTQFIRWVPTGMPRIPDRYLYTVFYLYPTAADAKAGTNVGGTGFLVCMKIEKNPAYQFVYAVTNIHVARGGASVIRLTKRDGTPDIFDLGPENWIIDPDGHDVAIVPVTASDATHQVAFLPFEGLQTKANMAQVKVGVGDDVFMMGCFVDHDGGTANMPTVRFGNISMMPTPIKQPHGKKQPTYCLDMHSRTGYSGSPVFVYRTPGWDLSEMQNPKEMTFMVHGTQLLTCLGIHCGQFPELWKVGGKLSKVSAEADAKSELDGRHIEGVSGMTGVVPAWAIIDLLMGPELTSIRIEAEKHVPMPTLETTLKPEIVAATPERPATPPDGDDQSKERFTALEASVLGKPKQGG